LFLSTFFSWCLRPCLRQETSVTGFSTISSTNPPAQGLFMDAGGAEREGETKSSSSSLRVPPKPECDPESNNQCLCEEMDPRAFKCGLQCSDKTERLDKAFEAWPSGYQMSKEAIPEFCMTSLERRISRFYCITLHNKKIFWKKCSSDGDLDPDDNDMQHVNNLLTQLLNTVALPTTQFCILLGDEPTTTKIYHSPMPVFSWTYSLGFWEIAFPHSMHLKSFELIDQYVKIPFEKKLSKLYFRGTISTQAYGLKSAIPTLPRMELLRLSLLHPELFDVGYTGIDSDNEEWQIITKNILENKMNLYRQKNANFADTLPKYKYILNVDGVLASFRMAVLLRSGSVVFMQKSYSEEFFVNQLIPWVHYVPIKYDLSDLVEKILVLENDQMLAKKIAKAGEKFAALHIRKADMYCHIWHAISAIAKMQTGYAKDLNEKQLEIEDWIAVPANIDIPIQCSCCNMNSKKSSSNQLYNDEMLGFCPK
jgi:hypothetical protein